MSIRAFQLSPRAYQRITLVAVWLLAVIIVTGGAVRLSGSGLGCPDWPACSTLEQHGAYDGHTLIEFLNRMFTGLVSFAVIVCVLGSMWRVPRRRDLTLLSLGLVAGVFGQALLGGLVVIFELQPWLVMAHFLLSLALLTNGIVLHRRAALPEGPAQLIVDARVRTAGRFLLVVAGAVVVAGTVVTATGPHGGDEKAKRFNLDLPEVARVHGSLVVALIFLTVVTFWLLRRTRAPVEVQRRLGVLFAVILVQGAIGYIQYFNDIPAVLVGFHIAGATAMWAAALWYYLGLSTREEPVAVLPDDPPRAGDGNDVSSLTDAVAVEGLERTFDETRAVDGVDLVVPPGQIYGFLGPNGAGKSTMVKILCTLITPTAGVARVAGHDVVREPKEVRLRIGAALQEASLDPNQTGTELLVLQGRLYGLTNAEIVARVHEVSQMIDIGDTLDRRIKTYSGGMRRRLDLGAALVHRPEVLFLDEPTTGLDPASRARVWEEVRRLNDAGMTIFLTTQYLEEADALAHRVGIIDHGKIIAEGTPTSLKQALGSDVIVAVVEMGAGERAANEVEHLAGVERVERHGDELTIVTPSAPTMLSSVAVALEACGVKVLNLTMRTPTLDDVFLELTGAHLGRDDEEPEELS